MIAVGDVHVTVYQQDSGWALRHSFENTRQDWQQHWEVSLEGKVVLDVAAQLVSGPFAESWVLRLPHGQPVLIEMQFFGSNPRIIVYGAHQDSTRIVLESM